jgi:hypothetical protein
VANFGTGYVLKVDLVRRRVVRRISVGIQPRQVLLANRSLWVTNQGSGTVSRIRP